MKLKGKIFVLVLITGLIFGLFGCSKKAESGSGGGEKKSFTIAYASASLTNEVFANQVKAMQAYCQQKGYAFYNKPDETPQDRYTSIENYIQQGVDVIIAYVDTPDVFYPLMKEAQAKGIKWFAYDAEMDGADVNFSVKSNYEFGKSAAVVAEPWIKATFAADEPVYACSANWPDTILGVDRDRGYREYLAEKCPNVVWVTEAKGGNQPNGVVAGEMFLQTGKYINLIIGINDGGCLGVYEAFKAAGHVGPKVGIFGLDATKDAIAALKEPNSIYRGTVSTNLSGLAPDFIDLAVKIVTEGPQGNHYFEMLGITPENVNQMVGKY